MDSNYNKLSGEVEARNAQTRLDMSEEERKNTTLAETEDVDRDEQIVRYSIIPKDLPLTEDGRVNGAQMIKNGEIMRLAEVIFQDKGIDSNGNALRFVMPKIPTKTRDDLSMNVAAISNGTLAEMKERVDRMMNMPSIHLSNTPSDRSKIKAELVGKTYQLGEDNINVYFTNESIGKIYGIEMNEKIGLISKIKEVMSSSMFVYS